MRSLLAHYANAVMAAATGRGGVSGGCLRDCSGRGDCLNGTCLCEIRYSGDECSGPNLPYHACIGGVFLVVALVCAIQLCACIVTEYRRLKAPTFLRACRVTTQKMLYFVTFLASLIRGAYFVSPSAFEEGWATSLLSAYYPLLMSGSSLIVCFWAEVFHLRNVRWEQPQFLSKSFPGFATFNLIVYSLLAAEFVTTNLLETSLEKRHLYQHIFNGCYAFLLLVVVVFFLIYGVEVYFKVRGGFLSETKVCTIVSRRRSSQEEGVQDVEETKDMLVTKQGIETDLTNQVSPSDVNQSQLQQSRFGLVAQALMLILIVGFLASETLGEFWKAKVPVNSRNWHDLVFRLAEIGVALWFPCVLWNCMAPERLWLLNPRRLLASQLDDVRLADLLQPRNEQKPLSDEAVTSRSASGRDCWICYDGDKDEPLIRPCRCTGDVSSVHHSCLRHWLVESSTNVDAETLKCKVCKAPYEVEQTSRLDWERGFTAEHWSRTVACVSAMCVAGAAAWTVVQISASPVLRVLAAGGALLVAYIAIRFLGVDTVTAYKRAKVSSINIKSTPLMSGPSTISDTVTVHMSSLSKEALKPSMEDTR